MKIVTIVGARPQFIKAAPLSRVLRQRHSEVLVHTGQHYDRNMSEVFFDELGIPPPDYNLAVGSGPHGWQTGQMLERIEDVLLKERPERVLVYGDTNSTLAGALAAAKLHLPIGHVEAGLRSFNRRMPEELNRLVSDHLADLLLCPCAQAAENLKAEGITRGVHVVGDVMADALCYALAAARNRSRILEKLHLTPDHYLLATIHRPENTDAPQRLRQLMEAFAHIPEPVILPLHPRTRKQLDQLGLAASDNPRFIEPLGYLDMVALEQAARLILTDSGGIQKEAYWLGVPCITLREQTEWVETVAAGWNVVAGAEMERILELVRSFAPPAARPELYGDGQAAARCAALLGERG